jgi:hypothetical protein
MSGNTIQRPNFYDGEILDANDLNLSLSYARDQLARHERYFHSWGICNGFGLSFNNGVVTVAAGVAVDVEGRELVLLAPQQLDPAGFSSAQVFDPDPSQKDAWYPVFVRALVNNVSPASNMGACPSSSQPTAKSEDVQFIFKASWAVTNNTASPATPKPGGLSDTPTAGDDDILIGFVQWNPSPSPGQFSNAQNSTVPPTTTPPTPSINRRLAGVVASRVEGIEGALTLQTRENPGGLKVVLQEASGSTLGSLTFGSPDPSGKLLSLFQVDSDGNLVVKGSIKSDTPLAPGTVSIQSGLATDGVILPLPPGVSEPDVTSGAIALHIQVTPVLPDVSQNTPPGPFAAFPLTCHVGRGRRVQCLIRTLSAPLVLATGPGIVDSPGSCHYIIIATSTSS